MIDYGVDRNESHENSCEQEERSEVGEDEREGKTGV